VVVISIITVTTGDTGGIAHTMVTIIGTMDTTTIMVVAMEIDGTDRIEAKETLIMAVEQEPSITILATKIVLDSESTPILQPIEEMIKFLPEVEVVKT
jgi:hypothetical protein